VGLVSRIHPLFLGNKPKNAASDSAQLAANPDRAQPFPEQILRRCVPMEAIRSLLD